MVGAVVGQARREREGERNGTKQGNGVLFEGIREGGVCRGLVGK